MFSFNGMLRDDDVMDLRMTVPQEEGVGNSYDFGARMYDPRVGRFFSLDPMKNKMPWQSPYIFADDSPVIATDKNGETTFYIHGSAQSSKNNNDTYLRRSVDYLHSNLSTSTGNVDYGFDWGKNSKLTNGPDDRKQAARDLADYIIKNNKPGDDITLIGYSHGGNVALQASQMISLELKTKVNIISIATPASNADKGDFSFIDILINNDYLSDRILNNVNKIENPENNPGVNDMIHFWLNDDGVAGGLFRGNDTYESSKVRNIHINDGNKDWGSDKPIYYPNFINAHGFIFYPSMIQNTVESQNVQPLKPIKDKE